MNKIERRATGVETLTLTACPCCGGDVNAGDYGYSSFNPGDAECSGECKRKWELGYVNDKWDAGKRWNQLAKDIQRKMCAFSLLKVDQELSTSRDFAREELKEEALRLLKTLEAVVIGAVADNNKSSA